jgi:hypothetical protein
MNRQLLLSILEIDGPAGAELLARPALSLLEEDAVAGINGVLQGYCLGVLYIDGLSFVEVLVIGILHLSGTLLSAQAAGNALVHIHVSGGLPQGYGEVTLFSLDPDELGEGEQLYVDMPADLDQFR